ncbi:hypothetical protein SAMN04487939_101599 [Lysobacter sp. yr284]|nr:hypothetical protein SAMN04487939_101599 [Lysobacter sp. yr284]
MTDERAPARAAADCERTCEERAEYLAQYLARFLAELDARADAIDAALHFDDRAAVKPGYDELMRVAAAYRERWPRLRPLPCACAQTADADACREAVAAAEAVAAVLGEMSAGASGYQALAGELARARARLAAALARPPR